MRIGYLVVPPRLRDRMRDASHHTAWYVSPISTALATRWLADGTAWRRLLAQRRELAARHRLCARHLEGRAWRGEPHCPHVWLELPAGRSAAFARQAMASGVVVVPSAVFAVSRGCEEGVRISIGAATDRGSLAEALARLAALRS